MKLKLGNELILIFHLTIFLVLIITLFPSSILRIILGLPFVLFLPGYTLMASLFTKKSSLGNIERVVLSFVMSLVVVTLIGLLLNFTPWGIRLYPIIVSITIFIIITSVIAWFRRYRLDDADRYSVSLNIGLRLRGSQSTLDKVIYIALVAVIVCAVIAIGYAIAVPRHGENYTEFYILESVDGTIGYPGTLEVSEEGKVVIGIVNHEQHTVTYRLEVTINNVKNNEIDPIVLEDEGKWENEVTFVPQVAGKNQKVEFLLYKGGQVEPYIETLHLWINVEPQ